MSRHIMNMMSKAHGFLKRTRAISRGVHALGYGRRCGSGRRRYRRRGGALSPAGGALHPVGWSRGRGRNFMASRRGLHNLPMNY